MTAADLATAGFIDEWMRALAARLDQLGAARAPQAAGGATEATVVLYSVGRLAEVLQVHPETVRAWLKKGKRGRAGEVVRLQAYYFTSEPRIPWPAVLAYHRGDDFDLDALPAPVPAAPPAPATPAPSLTPPAPAADDAPRLRVA